MEHQNKTKEILCLGVEYLSVFNNFKKNFNSKFSLMNQVSTEVLTTGWMIPSGTNSPPAAVSTQW